MKLENQVCSLELAKKLKELGVKQESFFCWAHPWEPYTYTADKSRFILTEPSKLNIREGISAFNVAELGEMLPDQYHSWHTVGDGFTGWCCVRFSEPEFEIDEHWEYGEDLTEADCRAKMLIHLIEKGIIKP